MSDAVTTRRGIERLRTGPWPLLLAIGLYLLTIAVLTWPMPLHPGTQVFSDGGDAWAEIGSLRELAQGPLVPFVPHTIHDFAAPEGYETSYALYTAMWASVLPKWLIAVAAGPVFAFNAWVVLGFLLSATAMFLLARWLTGSWTAALVAGWAVAFFPFAVANARSHLEFAHSWPIVLMIWRMLVIRNRATIRNGVLAGLAAVVCLSFNSYFVLIGGTAFAALVAGLLVVGWRERALRAYAGALGAASAVVAVVLAAYAAVNATAPVGAVRSYSLTELYIYSARPLNYLVPHPGSTLFAGAGDGWWVAHQRSGIVESGIYLGLTTIALALVAVATALVRRGRLRRPSDVWLVAWVAVVAAALSAPPTFQPAGLTIYMPSWFVFELVPTWRVFSRFGLLVMVTVTLLAAIGLAQILRNRSRVATLVVGSLVAALVVLDLWTHPSPASLPLPRPAVYETIARQPPGIVAEYPLFANVIPEYSFALYQGIHDHPILNYYGQATRQESRALWIANLEDRDTAGQLALLGVRYVLLHAGAPAGVPPPGTPRRGFTRIADQDGGTLYRVDAQPSTSLVWPAQGFSYPEGTPGHQFAWMVEPKGEVDVIARCRSCKGTVRMEMASFARPRRVRIRDASGRVLLDRQITEQPQPVAFEAAVDRGSRFTIETDPGPESVTKATGAPDPRDLAVLVREPRFTEKR